ncbi:MAG: SCO family protein [Acidobacteria bacterium]|nr:SCO family protein [Acidobacteriota bacterium]
MKSMRRSARVALLGAALFTAALPARAAAQKAGRAQEEPARAAAPAAKWGTRTARERFAARNLPNVELTTHEGRKVRFYDDLVKDKIVIFNFMYVRCEGTCPGTTANLLRVQKLLGDRVGKDIFMYSITLRPEEDTPQVLARYAKAHKVGPGWTFLTGTPENIETLRRRMGFIDLDPARDADKSNHISMLRFGNEPETRWAGCPAKVRPTGIVKLLGFVERRGHGPKEQVEKSKVEKAKAEESTRGGDR